MEAVQHLFTEWVANLSTLIPLGYAFGAGMVSTVNPCGFALLPAYLALFLGSRQSLLASSGGPQSSESTERVTAVSVQVLKAVVVAAVVSGGFVLFYGGVGAILSAGGRVIIALVPWMALVIGAVLVVMGILMLRGRHLSAGFAARIASRVGDPRSVGIKGFFLFGLAYAIGSLSCTLPIFLTVVGASLAVGGFASATLQFVSYALGMGLILLVLTVGMALLRGTTEAMARKVLPFMEQLSAWLMIVAGSYIVYYWLFKGRLIDRLT